MSEWRDVTVAELGKLYDGPHATPTRITNGPYFLNISSLEDGRLDLGKSDHVSEPDFVKWTRRIAPAAGDLLFSYETRLGEAALMPTGVRACLGRRMALIRPDQSVVEPRFLLYLYLSPVMQSLIERHTIHGATVNRIALSTMPRWQVPLPPLREQRAIAEVLGALDDKIAANVKLVTIADSLAESQVKTATRGSGLVSLASVASITMGSSPAGATLNESGEGVVFYQGVRDFGVRFPTRRIWTTAPVRMAKTGDTLLSVRAPVGRVNFADEELCIGRGLAAVRSTNAAPNTLFNLLKAFPTLWAPFEAEGTVFGSINRGQLESIMMPAVSRDRAGAVERDLAAIEQRIAIALAENRTLAATRDALLPQLMSGRLRLQDAESLVADVV